MKKVWALFLSSLLLSAWAIDCPYYPAVYEEYGSVKWPDSTMLRFSYENQGSNNVTLTVKVPMYGNAGYVLAWAAPPEPLVNGIVQQRILSTPYNTLYEDIDASNWAEQWLSLDNQGAKTPSGLPLYGSTPLWSEKEFDSATCLYSQSVTLTYDTVVANFNCSGTDSTQQRLCTQDLYVCAVHPVIIANPSSGFTLQCSVLTVDITLNTASNNGVVINMYKVVQYDTESTTGCYFETTTLVEPADGQHVIGVCHVAQSFTEVAFTQLDGQGIPPVSTTFYIESVNPSSEFRGYVSVECTENVCPDNGPCTTSTVPLDFLINPDAECLDSKWDPPLDQNLLVWKCDLDNMDDCFKVQTTGGFTNEDGMATSECFVGLKSEYTDVRDVNITDYTYMGQPIILYQDGKVYQGYAEGSDEKQIQDTLGTVILDSKEMAKYNVEGTDICAGVALEVSALATHGGVWTVSYVVRISSDDTTHEELERVYLTLGLSDVDNEPSNNNIVPAGGSADIRSNPAATATPQFVAAAIATTIATTALLLS